MWHLLIGLFGQLDMGMGGYGAQGVAECNKG